MGSETLFGKGAMDFLGGSATDEYLAYVLAPATDATVLHFEDGTAVIYDLGYDYFFGLGGMGWSGGDAVIYVLEPYGGFEDFAIFPETGSDPLNGFVVAGAVGTSGTVGNPWTRHFMVVIPPKRARYAVPHIKLGTLATTTAQYLDGHQLEVLRSDLTAPTAFGSPRSIIATVRPTRLNYASGNNSVSGLIAGRTYTASATVSGVRQSYQFLATGTTVTLTFAGGATKILVEEGTVLGDYFDGSYGDDYLWEQGGTPFATRSYYYQDRANRHSVLVRTLQDNAALGVSVNAPIYATLPAPSSTG